MKYNITTVVLSLAVAGATFFGISQYSQKRVYKNSYDSKLVEITLLEGKLSSAESQLTNQKLLLKEAELMAEERNTEIGLIEAKYSHLKKKMATMSTEDKYALINGEIQPIDSLEWMFSDNQIDSIYKLGLEMKECNEITGIMHGQLDDLAKVNSYLKNNNIVMSRELEECEFDRIELELNKEKCEVDKKILKRKVWVNRLWGGVVTGLAILIAL
jgi:hypothetical protein